MQEDQKKIKQTSRVAPGRRRSTANTPGPLLQPSPEQLTGCRLITGDTEQVLPSPCLPGDAASLQVAPALSSGAAETPSPPPKEGLPLVVSSIIQCDCLLTREPWRAQEHEAGANCQPGQEHTLLDSLPENPWNAGSPDV